DELLEEVRLLVGALRRAEPGDRARTAGGVDLQQPAGDQVQRLLPGGLPEVRQHLVVVDQAAGLAPAVPALLRRPAAAAAVAAGAGPAPVVVHVATHVRGQRPLGIRGVDPDQRHCQPLRRGRVVPAVPALHAQPALRAGLRTAFRERDRVALPVDVVGQRAADPAVRADAVDRVEPLPRLDRDEVDRLVGQRAGRAGLDALAAGDAGAVAHRVVEVERDPGGVALARASDDVVALDVVAGPHAPVAEDAGIVVDVDDRVRRVGAAATRTGQLGGLAGHVEPVGQ